MILIVWLFVLILGYESVWASENILCSEEFCQAYVEKNDCIITNAACHVQNSTLHGELFPNAGPCSCCTVCLQHLEKGEFCTVGSADTPTPLLVCGPHLICTDVKNNGVYTCEEMDTPCLRERKKFEEKLAKGETVPFEHLPTCDGSGKYGPIRCNAFTCFCIDESGKRIFGEAKRTDITELTMKCECSRLHSKISKISKFLDIFPITRCLEDGSFDPLQCMENNCNCVERETGSPNGRMYNTSQYSTLPCFNSTIHRTHTYLHDCEKIQWDFLDELQQSEEESFTVLESEMPPCQPDGWFLPTRVKENSKYCVDKYNRPFGGYFGPKDSKMTCNCARAQYILKWHKIMVLPKCTKNGDFEKVQCKDKKCFCVDEKNGLSTGKWKPIEDLKLLRC